MAMVSTFPLVLVACLAGLASGRSGKLAPLLTQSDDPISGRYIVKLKAGRSVDATLDSLRGLERLASRDVLFKYEKVFPGFAAELTSRMVAMLRASDAVEYIQEDGVVKANSVASWGLDRIDQFNLPLDGIFRPRFFSPDFVADVYVFDTGINYGHQDFGGRAHFGFDVFGENGEDCNGHGSHTAATIAGETYGVAKTAPVHSVRVLDCSGFGSWSGIVAACEWVADNTTEVSVVSMSLGGNGNQACDDAVQYLSDDGVTVVVAAGNDDNDACLKSPARAPTAITVGATDSQDARAYFSNYGSCVDIFAPGVSITSAWIGGDSAQNTISGTSMSCPHVTGAAAIHLGVRNTITPAQVRAALLAEASNGLITDAMGSPNKLLYIGMKDRTDVTCTSTSMTVMVPLNLLEPGASPSDIHFDDEYCVGYGHDPLNVAISTRYDRCQTAFTETDTEIIYSNTVTYYTPEPINGTGITRENILKFNVKCKLDRETLLGDFFRPKIGIISGEEVGFGNFSLSLDRYDETYDHPVVNDAAEVVLGDHLYFAINLTSTPGLSVFAERCWATPSTAINDPSAYEFVVDGCPSDPTFERIDRHDPSFSAFKIDAFAFLDEIAQVFVHCDVLVCDGSDPSSRCAQGCQSRVRRSGRQARGSSSAPHLISNGPFYITSKPADNAPVNAHSEGAPSTTAASGVLIATLVGSVLLVAGMVIAIAAFMKSSRPPYRHYHPVDVTED